MNTDKHEQTREEISIFFHNSDCSNVPPATTSTTFSKKKKKTNQVRNYNSSSNYLNIKRKEKSLIGRIIIKNKILRE